MQALSKTIGKTLSSYTQAMNIQNKTTGTLFQKKTKAKCLTDIIVEGKHIPATEYLLNCFGYIHLNPVQANLVSKPEEWRYSSWPDYTGIRNGSLCNMKNAMELLNLSPQMPLSLIDPSLDEAILKNIW